MTDPLFEMVRTEVFIVGWVIGVFTGIVIAAFCDACIRRIQRRVR